MKISLLFLFTTLTVAVGTEVLESKEGSAKSMKHEGHPLPPVMMPGIINKFLRRKREATQINAIPLEIYANAIQNSDAGRLIRTRRNTKHPRPFPEIQMRSRRNKRDLRRLRRDLRYAAEYAQPYHASLQNPHRVYPHFRQDTEGDLNSLLEGADLLDRLSILKQIQGILPPFKPSENHWPLHAPASRFAPQPKLFEDNAQVRVQATPLGWTTDKPKGVMTWSPPEKRWSKAHIGDGLSMMPGFKRSVFREAARQRADHPPLSEKELLSLASILGAEIDANEGRIRRMAM